MEGRHTPSPWDVEKRTSSRVLIIKAPGYGLVATIRTERFSEAEIEANSKLIAAAPELLEALEKIALGDGWQAIIAHAAIAKAKGE